MEIFGIGLPEVMIIAIVAMIVLGPDRLPEAARTIGKAVADFRRAIEPARNAWADVSREITSSLDMPAPGTAPAASNPWNEHPVAEGLSPQEKETFFRTGEIPAWKREELDRMDTARHNGNNGALAQGGESGEVGDLDYPMPHAEMTYKPAPPFAQELSYPQPGTVADPEEQV